MPPTRQDRRPERTDGIQVELTEFGLWIEVQDQPGGWQGVFLSARALRRLVTLPPEARLAALAALDPAKPPPPTDDARVAPGPAPTTTIPEPPNEQKGREWGADRIWE